MRPGGGHAKGAEWERQVGKQLSMWLTAGERPDIFSRNVLSGGAFTIAASKGLQSSRLSGDLMAAHPEAFKFLSKFMVECKHLQTLGIEGFLFDMTNSSPLGQIIMYAAGQAAQAKVDYMIIAKQNRRLPIIITDGSVGKLILLSIEKSARTRLAPPHHVLHRGRIFLMELQYLVTMIKPDMLLENMR